MAETAVQDMIAAHQGKEVGRINPLNVRVLQVPEAAVEHILANLANHPNVEFAEPDYVLEPDATPNDLYFSSQWHLAKIQCPAAWDAAAGSSSVIIAVLDSGVDSTHPDLAASLVPGWNFYDNNADTSDVFGHGTLTAGTAAAIGNNAIGVASPATGCRLMPIRITDTSGLGYSSTMSQGLTWAADHGARIANISFRADYSSTIVSAAQYFASKGGVVTMSAGNDGTTYTTAETPYILVTGATDSSDTKASFSNMGTNIDLTAPGVSILTTSRGGGYSSVSGTSFAAPTTAGVAALVLSANPGLTGAEVQSILKQSADDLGVAGWDPSYGWGRVNAARAVSLALTYVKSVDTTAPSVSLVSPANGSTVSGTVTVQATASDNVGVACVYFYIDGVKVATVSASPYNYPWNTKGLANALHTLQAVAVDGAGNTTVAQSIVTVYNYVDTTPPSIGIVSPAAGTTVTRDVSVGVSTSDNVGVVKVELYVDGKLTNTSTKAPFTTTWNASKAKAGSHSLLCKAYDATGNQGISQTVTVTK